MREITLEVAALVEHAVEEQERMDALLEALSSSASSLNGLVSDAREAGRDVQNVFMFAQDGDSAGVHAAISEQIQTVRGLVQESRTAVETFKDALERVEQKAADGAEKGVQAGVKDALTDSADRLQEAVNPAVSAIKAVQDNATALGNDLAALQRRSLRVFYGVPLFMAIGAVALILLLVWWNRHEITELGNQRVHMEATIAKLRKEGGNAVIATCTLADGKDVPCVRVYPKLGAFGKSREWMVLR